MIQSRGVPAEAIPDPIDAARTCLALLPDYDGQIVCSSLYLAGDVREALLR